MSEELHEGDLQQVSAQIGYDPQEPNMAYVAAAGAAIMVALILIMYGLQMHFDSLEQQQIYTRVLEPVSKAYQDIRAREDNELNTYEYKDRGAGKVRIPVQRAMQLLASETASGKFFYPGKATSVAASTQPPAAAPAPSPAAAKP